MIATAGCSSSTTMVSAPGIAMIGRWFLPPSVPKSVGIPIRSTTAAKRGADIQSVSGARVSLTIRRVLQVENQPRRDRPRATDHHRIVRIALRVAEHRVAVIDHAVQDRRLAASAGALLARARDV